MRCSRFAFHSSVLLAAGVFYLGFTVPQDLGLFWCLARCFLLLAMMLRYQCLGAADLLLIGYFQVLLASAPLSM